MANSINFKWISKIRFTQYASMLIHRLGVYFFEWCNNSNIYVDKEQMCLVVVVLASKLGWFLEWAWVTSMCMLFGYMLKSYLIQDTCTMHNVRWTFQCYGWLGVIVIITVYHRCFTLAYQNEWTYLYTDCLLFFHTLRFQIRRQTSYLTTHRDRF